MRESDMTSKITLSHEVMLARLTQSDDMREFFIEMWKQNPALANQGGEKMRNLLFPLPDPMIDLYRNQIEHFSQLEAVA